MLERKADIYFKENLRKLRDEGVWDENPRAKYKDGTPARTKFITHVFETYDLSMGELPLNTLRTTAIKSGIQELIWVYSDMSNDLSKLHDRGVYWWDAFDVGDGTIGIGRYGDAVRKTGMMHKLLNGLKKDPFGRRHIMSLWQTDELEKGPGLYPCCFETLWSVNKNSMGELCLDMVLVQRSSDYVVSSAINKTQYVALQMMVARHCGYKLGKFSHLINNLHAYDRHLSAIDELLERDPMPFDKWPGFRLSEDASTDFWEMAIEDFIFIDLVKRSVNNKLELAI